jgi:hypothetical protein
VKKKYKADYYLIAFKFHLGEILEEMSADGQSSGVILDPNKIDNSQEQK